MNKGLRYRSKNFAVYSAVFRSDPTGAREEMEYIEQPPVAIAVPLLPSGQILLVEQWRPLLNQTMLECPGGKLEPGESIQDAIRRELSEEVGMVPDRIEPLGAFYTSVGASTERIHCVIASQMRNTTRSAADTKRMSLRYFQPAELHTLLQRGILPDGKTNIALNHFFARSAPASTRTRTTTSGSRSSPNSASPAAGSPKPPGNTTTRPPSASPCPTAHGARPAASQQATADTK